MFRVSSSSQFTLSKPGLQQGVLFFQPSWGSTLSELFIGNHFDWNSGPFGLRWIIRLNIKCWPQNPSEYKVSDSAPGAKTFKLILVWPIWHWRLEPQPERQVQFRPWSGAPCHRGPWGWRCGWRSRWDGRASGGSGIPGTLAAQEEPGRFWCSGAEGPSSASRCCLADWCSSEEDNKLLNTFHTVCTYNISHLHATWVDINHKSSLISQRSVLS